MYAIVEVGGKQYKVEPNTYFKTEKIDANVGDKVELPCLLVADGEKVTIAANNDKKVKAKVIEKITMFGSNNKA